MKNTPGPWSVEKWPTGRVEIVAGSDRAPLAEVWGEDGNTLSWPQTSNARLIAAAPELLEALKELFKCGCKQGWQDKYEDAMKLADSAISKAEEKS